MTIKITTTVIKPEGGLFFGEASLENYVIVQDSMAWILGLPGCIGLKTSRDWVNNISTMVSEWATVEDAKNYQAERLAHEITAVTKEFNDANNIIVFVDQEVV